MASRPTPALPSDTELIQAQAELWRHSLLYLKQMTFKCAIELGIPTAIHNLGGTASLPELSVALSLPPAKQPYLTRLMRQLASSGVFTVVDGGDAMSGTYGLTPLSSILIDGVRIDGDAHQEAIVLALSSKYYVEAAMGLTDWFRKDHATPIPSPFEDVHGAVPFEESMERLDPESAKLFNQALAAHDHMGIGVLLRQCGQVFSGLRSLTDCCGGDGTTARSIAKAFPHVKCTVLDLPQVINNAPPSDGSVTYVAGDMFHSIPPSQAVMLKVVLHFWSDENCVKILSQCKKAIPSRADGGKVIIIDVVIGSSTSGPILETQLLLDMIMLVNFQGRQRDENDWSHIFKKAGFSEYKIVKKLGARCVFEVVLHFWSDENCVKILAQRKKAIPARADGGKVIIIDVVIGSRSSTSGPILEAQLLMDMLMLVNFRSRQRDENDWSDIFKKAGFSEYKIVSNWELDVSSRSIHKVVC
uniref:O-methyltransferase domain-containing protein n=1 Tax=Oryza brachyantha TaxID=4533 RepID=J3MKX8_ORYBR